MKSSHMVSPGNECNCFIFNPSADASLVYVFHSRSCITHTTFSYLTTTRTLIQDPQQIKDTTSAPTCTELSLSLESIAVERYPSFFLPFNKINTVAHQTTQDGVQPFHQAVRSEHQARKTWEASLISGLTRVQPKSTCPKFQDAAEASKRYFAKDRSPFPPKKQTIVEQVMQAVIQCNLGTRNSHPKFVFKKKHIPASQEPKLVTTREALSAGELT